MARALLMAVSVLAAVALASAASASGRRTPARSTCGLDKYRGLIGRRVDDLPAFPLEFDWRLVSSQAIGATIYKPARLTIVWNTATGRVSELVCR